MTENQEQAENNETSKMNYTRPNDPNHIDDPKQWLNGALIFSRALGLIIPENEGIVVKLVGDMSNPSGTDCDHVVLFRKDGMIHINDCKDMKEGTRLILKPIEEKPVDDENPFGTKVVSYTGYSINVSEE